MLLQRPPNDAYRLPLTAKNRQCSKRDAKSRTGKRRMTTALTDSIADLSKRFSSQLLQAADPSYDDARKIHNGLIDKRPALIARCRGKSDVVDAIQLAREQSLQVAVRGGGHNVAGRSTTEGGLMIDLSQMTGIRVDQKARTARAEGGSTWG